MPLRASVSSPVRMSDRPKSRTQSARKRREPEASSSRRLVNAAAQEKGLSGAPKAKSNSDVGVDGRDHTAVSGLSPIDRLGWDCLGIVFSYLDVVSLCAAARTCRLWRDVASQRALWKRVDLGHVRVKDWDGMVGRCANTTSVRLSGSPERDRDRYWRGVLLVLQRLDNLASLSFASIPVEVLEKVASHLPKLQSLVAEELQFGGRVVDGMAWLDFGCLASMKWLRVLRLYGNTLFGAAAFSFAFSHHSGLEGLQAIGTLSKLESLRIVGLFASPEDFHCLGSLTSLKDLDMSASSWCAPNFSLLGSLPSIETLTLRGGAHRSDGMLADVLPKMKRLRELRLRNFDFHDALHDAVAHHPSIRLLDVRMACRSERSNANILRLIGSSDGELPGVTPLSETNPVPPSTSIVVRWTLQEAPSGSLAIVPGTGFNLGELQTYAASKGHAVCV